MTLSAPDDWATPTAPIQRKPMGAPTAKPSRAIVPFDDDEVSRGTTVRLPVSIWSELEHIIKFEKAMRAASGLPGAFKLNDLLRHFMLWSIEQYWLENGPRPGDDKQMRSHAPVASTRRAEKAQAAADEQQADE